MRLLAFLIGCALEVLWLMLLPRSSDPIAHTMSVSAEDTEMNAAIEHARRTLPKFWTEFEHPRPNESDFGLKLKITDGDVVEHFWLVDLERRSGKIYGTIDDDPEFVRTVKAGDRIPIPEKDISDWEYLRDGRMVGAFTTRGPGEEDGSF